MKPENIKALNNTFSIGKPEKRAPIGFGKSPYPFFHLIRYFLNIITNGFFSYINPDRKKMEKLSEKVLEDIKKKSEADILIGFAHANEEQSYYPLKETRDRWIKWMGRDKFDLIVGHGPHVVQSAEKLKEGLIFHSIGNFCSPKGPSQTKIGCIPMIMLKHNKKKITSMATKAKFFEQDEENIKLLDKNVTKLPKIVTRLQKIFKKEVL